MTEKDDSVTDQESDEDILSRARERFSHVQAAEADNREEALEDIEFCDLGEQWPDDVRSEREKDNRPCLVINKTPLYVRQIVNEIRQIRPAIKVRGVDSASDPDTAEILNGMVRAIEADSSAESAYDWAAECAAKAGFGYWRITTDYCDDDTFDQHIKIERVRNCFSCYVDPASTRQNASDMRYAFVVEDLSKKEFEDKYPDAKGEWDAGTGDDNDWWFGEDRVRIAEYWEVVEGPYTLLMIADPETGRQMTIRREDYDLFDPEIMPPIIAERKATERKVVQYLMTGSEILERNEWAGKYIPIIRVLGRESDIEGELRLKGIVRDMRDPQRQYNYMRSAMIERIALAPKAPYVGPEGSFKNRKWREANKKNHAYLEYTPVAGQPPPRRESPPEISAGLAHEVATASEELKAVTGIYDAGIGARSNEVSGVAIDSRRAESDVSNFDFVDNLARAMTYSGKVLVDLIPKIYTGARMVRIVRPDGTDETVTVNQPYVDDKQKNRNYDISAGRYDVSVDVGPSYATQRKEAADSMLEMLKAFPQLGEIIGDLVAKNFDWPESDEISKRLKLLMPIEILQDENPAFKQAIAQKDQQIGQLQQQMQALMTEAQRMSIELQNGQNDSAIKQGELLRKIKKDLMDYTEGMTDLEIKAAKDLAPQGLAY